MYSPSFKGLKSGKIFAGALLACFSTLSYSGSHSITWDNVGDPLWNQSVHALGLGHLFPREGGWAASDISSRSDKSASLSQRVSTQDGTWLKGKRHRAFDLYLESDITPTDSDAKGDLIQALMGNENTDGKNYCKAFLDLPGGLDGVWNGGWAGHSAGVSLGGGTNPSTSLSVFVATECDSVHNGYGFNVAVGASLSNPFLDTIELMQFPSPIKFTFNTGVGANIKASMGGGYTGWFNSVPHPIYINNRWRSPEYVYNAVSLNGWQNFTVNVGVGIGLTLNLTGTLNTVSASKPLRIEGGLTRDNNPNNWKFYVHTKGKSSATAKGGNWAGSVKLGVPPWTITLWRGTIASWSGYKLWERVWLDEFVKGKIVIDPNNPRNSRLASVRKM
ncbi:hypothetical protein D515_01118 [Grimontia indica]|uniref:Uncharacterized protein n=1 Tax=Grimontia indica TaxID=1056512 RepID=R1GVF3_9GAMM|nr:hypothetical protein [Grimontia indica]EOD79984.1 hypothetical protein D515_01118 [Grimontia indica]